jgi:protein-disulfide isomerase
MKTISLAITLLLLLVFTNTPITYAQAAVQPSDDTIRKFILANPEIILESLKRYEEKVEADTKTIEQQIIKKELALITTNNTSYIGGNPNGSITVIEFLDYKCGYCKKAHGQILELINSNPEIRFIVKEFPILGDESMIASKASVAVLLDQGSKVYRTFTERLLKFNGRITIDSIKNLLKSIGGETERIQKLMESKAVYNILNSNYNLAKQLKIRGTPTFIIGTEIVRGYKNVEELQNIISKVKQVL